MNIIKQKTEYWMIGALQRFVYCGIFPKSIIKPESVIDEGLVDWWELDETFKSWADQRIFMETAIEYLQGMPPQTIQVIVQKLATFTNHHSRYQMMQNAYNNLINNGV